MSQSVPESSQSASNAYMRKTFADGVIKLSKTMPEGGIPEDADFEAWGKEFVIAWVRRILFVVVRY